MRAAAVVLLAGHHIAHAAAQDEVVSAWGWGAADEGAQQQGAG
eukprot:gene20316-44798_t